MLDARHNMASKAKVNPLNGMHTAGIFSDMSVDGPEIGTLVLIVDRAKNLPNRKTIGKQDPYCAARLGKEAKKTTTDIRGGQTPKWDQELRFTVHDSPDYYQLKLSVFNDDKRTDLIGETWIDLRDIIVRGGGQSDQWHNLNCKGKYAGEVRIETTYYDSRPKPEKPAAKPKPVASASEPDLAGAAQRQQVKRRPLPSDPVTGQAPAPVVPDQIQTPPRAHPNPLTSFIPNQSPLQAVEYGTPPSNRHGNHLDHYSPVPPSGSQYVTPPRLVEKDDELHTHENDPFRPSDHRVSYNNNHASQNSALPPARHHQSSMDAGDRPPPPPVHRVRNGSGSSHEMGHRGSFDLPQHKSTQPMMRQDVLKHEAHRHSVAAPPSASSAYPGRPTYRPYDSAPTMPNAIQYHGNDPTASRHYSYDSAVDPQYRSMQPTVEDVPESWMPPNAMPRGYSSQASPYDDRDYSQVPSPAPLNLSGRNSAASEQYSPSHQQVQKRYDPGAYASSDSLMSSADYPQALTHVSRSSYSNQIDRCPSHHSELEDDHVHQSHDYDLPPVPPTLVPGVDPTLAREISDRVNHDRIHERRYTQPAEMTMITRGRQHSEPLSHYAANYSSHGHHPNHSVSYDRQAITYSGPSTPSGPSQPTRVSPSPSASHMIKRKSVSPAPPPSEERRLSGVPFGPDSYDALNPSVSTKDESKSSEYTNAEGKIVTPDGREIDPSDHLPMDTWAPEPEPKKPIASASDTRSRPIPAGAQPMPPSGRRQIRLAVRPQSMATPPTFSSDAIPSPPASAGRNRLQKKNRASVLPAPVSAGSSPLGPSTAHKRNSTPPRALVRASTFDYENHGPLDAYGAPRQGYGSAPPIPAKVPMMSGGLVTTSQGSRAPDEWALMDEMSRIDIGTGRSRRHGGY
ncbi:hypothetical protein F5Y15DRAFT_12718 [Xylariaceae sp. FL0016]|nr:hypothetical protein F5Y15DRAFT_12718 [Xylariaceae sp. FL0016]